MGDVVGMWTLLQGSLFFEGRLQLLSNYGRRVKTNPPALMDFFF